MDLDLRFRNAGRYAATQGYVDGFPNFHEADYGHGPVHGTLLLPAATVEWRDIPLVDLTARDAAADLIGNVPAMVRAVNRWAVANGFGGGIPTFEEAASPGGIVRGAMLFRPGVVQWRDVPQARIGAGGIGDVGAMMRGASDYAAANGYAAAFPTFEEADTAAGRVYGMHLFPNGTAAWEDVFAVVLKTQSDFSFDAGFTVRERQTVMERIAFAYRRLTECGNLTAEEQASVKEAFGKDINVTLNAGARANASAPVGGSTLNINRARFFALIPREQAQTLLHEMTHLAGFDHDARRDCPPGVNPPDCDRAGDNGPYFGSAPLRAELCIAGVQSDIACVPSEGAMNARIFTMMSRR